MPARPLRVRSSLHRFLRDRLSWQDGVRMPGGRRKVAVLAQFSTTSQLTRSVTELVRELNRHGYYVVLSSACIDPAPLRWHGEAPTDVAILRKPNVGYDMLPFRGPLFFLLFERYFFSLLLKFFFSFFFFQTFNAIVSHCQCQEKM